MNLAKNKDLTKNYSHPAVITDQKVYISQKTKGYMKKLRFPAKTLENKLIKDGLCAISQIDNNPFNKESYYAVGGIAVQSYIPPSHRRGTSDIDLCVVKPLNRKEAEKYAKPCIEYLLDNHYDIEKSEQSDYYLKKGQNAYEIHFNNGRDGAVIEFSRRSIENIRRNGDRLLRELEHSRLKVIPGKDLLYRVTSPEDIALPKLVRGIGTLKRNNNLIKRYIHGKFRAITDKEAQGYLKRLEELREEAIIHAGDPARSEELRIVADIYDIKTLIAFTGFNEQYLKEASREWNVLTTPSKERDALINFLVPDLIERYDEQTLFDNSKEQH
mgnify:CR=1 FL=1